MFLFGKRQRSSARAIRKIMHDVQTINEQQAALHAHSAEELRAAMSSIRAQGEGIEDDPGTRCFVFALVKEAVRRTLSIDMRDVQLAAGWAMADGKLTEMATGEGKTVTALLPACWFALQGKGVHMMTVNEYLSERDYSDMGPVFRSLGFSVGLNRSGAIGAAKQEAYKQDVTYGVCKEFGFDYLRDHLALAKGQRVQRPLAAAIVDEADSVLIDEARTPLIIADKQKADAELFRVGARIVQTFREGRYYETDRETRQAMFTDEAVGRLERMFQIGNLFDLEHMTLYHALLQSLRAKTLMKRDVDYIVRDGQVSLVDAFTGRVMEDRSYTDGLQQAIEAKEGVPLTDENRIQAEITIQKYCSLYERLVGMTGTALTDEEEIRGVYGIDVIAIPTAKPVIRHDEADAVFLTKEAKHDRIMQEIRSSHAKGQPVLVGAATILQSEELAERLRMTGIPFRLLNAKTEREEAEIIAEAGRIGAVTIATNMAGRGTDIKLGAGAADAGGLCVIGTERHESRRIDKQLRGRAGRQGDPGRSRFFVSLEDELAVRYGDPANEERFRRLELSGKEGKAEAVMRAYFDRLQQAAEARSFGVRSLVSQIDVLIHEQRQALYSHRDEVLDGATIKDYIAPHVRRYIRRLVLQCCPGDLQELWDLKRLAEKVRVLEPNLARMEDCETKQQLVRYLWACWAALRKRIAAARGIRADRQRWRIVYLKTLDRAWVGHLAELNRLKLGIHYRSYANQHPIQAFQEDAFKLYRMMKDRLAAGVGRWFLEEEATKLFQGAQPPIDDDVNSKQMAGG